MKAVHEWLQAFALEYDKPARTAYEVLEKLIPLIQSDAQHDLPPLPQLRVSDERAAEMAERMPKKWLPPWTAANQATLGSTPVYDADGGVLAQALDPDSRENAVFIAHARTDLPDLLADRATYQRILNDVAQEDLWRADYAAGVEAGRESGIAEERKRHYSTEEIS